MKMKTLLQTGLILLSFIAVSCGPTKEEKATVAFNKAELLYTNQNDTLGAANVLDSLIRVTKELPVIREKAIKTRKGYYRGMVVKRKEAIAQAETNIKSLSKNFVKQKEEFDRYALYVPKRQTLKRSWKRSFIEVHLDERGVLYLSSNYVGEKWLNHTGLRVYDKGEDAKTETVPLDSENNHHSDFMEMRWEKVNYKEGKSDEVIQFIADNVDRTLKAVFLGKRYHYIVLESYDKEAVRDALTLSNALKVKVSLESELASLRKRMNKKY